MLKFSQVRNASNEEWDNIWLNCSYSTYFHSREWAEVWQEYSNKSIQPDPRMVFFSDGKKALISLSCQMLFKGVIKYYLSSPAGTYGGWLSGDDLKKEHAALLTNYMTRDIKNLSWRLNPYGTDRFDIEPPGAKKEKTQALNLMVGFESLWQRWEKRKESLIRNIQKARKQDIIIKPAETLNEWKQYYEIYQDSLRRWGKRASSQYKWEFFQILRQKSSPYLKLWLAIYKKRIVSGILCFYAKNHVVYWHGATLEAYFKLRPVHLLMSEVIKHACDNTYTWFDFNPSGGHEGVWRFKKSFDPQELVCSVVSQSNLWYWLYSNSLKIKSRIKYWQ
jgi:lipid II:glycine glycyltransferase (peptidoglycan interpeptide bridge formation enzyme)